VHYINIPTKQGGENLTTCSLRPIPSVW